DAASALLSDARTSYPDDIAILGLLAQVRAAQGRHEEALALYRSILEKEPEHPEALYRAALSLRSSGRRDEAMDLAQRARAAGHPGAAALIAELSRRPPR